MKHVTLGITQFACSADAASNCDRAEKLARAAAAKGAQVILIQELFQTPYFCSEEDPRYFDLAQPLEGNRVVARFSALARELGAVIPVSFFERAGTAHYNSLAMVDADGKVLGLYRKSHIPDGVGYEEK